jgi:hypothetical protein
MGITPERTGMRIMNPRAVNRRQAVSVFRESPLWCR